MEKKHGDPLQRGSFRRGRAADREPWISLQREREEVRKKRAREGGGGERSVRPREILASGGAATFESSNRPGEGRGG